MTFDDLRAKCDSLAAGLMTLEAFKAWYTYETGDKPEAPPREAGLPAEPFTTKRGLGFDDYRYEPIDDEMRAHHRSLLGDGEME